MYVGVISEAYIRPNGTVEHYTLEFNWDAQISGYRTSQLCDAYLHGATITTYVFLKWYWSCSSQPMMILGNFIVLGYNPSEWRYTSDFDNQ